MFKNKPNLADFLRKRRQSIPNLTIGKLSLLTGLSRTIISRYETGQRNPSPSALKKLAMHLKVDYKYLLYIAGYLDDKDWEAISSYEIREPVEEYVPSLSPEEEKLLHFFRAIKNKDIRKGILLQLKGVAEIENKLNKK